MQLSEFLGRVQQQAGCDSREQALAAAQATLSTLSERLTGNEPRHLGAQLPEPLSQYLDQEGQGRRFSANEFCHLVAEREGVADDAAKEHARAVLQTLKEAVSEGEMNDVLDQLPQDYEQLFGAPGGSVH